LMLQPDTLRYQCQSKCQTRKRSAEEAYPPYLPSNNTRRFNRSAEEGCMEDCQKDPKKSVFQCMRTCQTRK
ncbi:hypothetical protein PMAYCL1PPCAC_22783, partial [Pristionchus mayeri]